MQGEWSGCGTSLVVRYEVIEIPPSMKEQKMTKDQMKISITYCGA